MSEKKKKPLELTYSEASSELEAILQEIESGTLDLDLLSDKVERAAALLAICRQKLAATETKVKKVVADLAGSAASPDEDDTKREDDA
ncbi:hypothetical protein LBMAG49_07960 [Planctomycetota bacterium]|nr:exodeoxyribonuclease VII small subunit [Planctomycetota bacterium]MSR38753.1 exodeoxyribonuclease VII small subunit [Planctomycetota bacterium]GDY01467.1 hypothetical protein LBMAG49_07960 [Planctomycetota bacterium]